VTLCFKSPPLTFRMLIPLSFPGNSVHPVGCSPSQAMSMLKTPPQCPLFPVLLTWPKPLSSHSQALWSPPVPVCSFKRPAYLLCVHCPSHAVLKPSSPRLSSPFFSFLVAEKGFSPAGPAARRVLPLRSSPFFAQGCFFRGSQSGSVP